MSGGDLAFDKWRRHLVPYRRFHGESGGFNHGDAHYAARGSPNAIYAGTGEGFYNADGIRGAGIFKSTTGGSTWSQLPSTNTSDFHYINRLALSPNGSILLAGTRTGLFRSSDGGSTFARVTGVGNDVTDVDFHSTDNGRAVASGYAGNSWYSTD